MCLRDREGNAVKGLLVYSNGNETAVSAEMVIDCTGEADVCYMAGCAMDYGRKSDGRYQPYTNTVIACKNGRTYPCLLYTSIREKWDRKKLIKQIVIVLLGFFAGVAVLGFDPYGKHIMEGKHILHPVMGSEKYDIMNTNPPAGMEDKNAVEKVFYSLFSKTGNSIDQEPVLKVPFRIYKDEWIHLSNADIRIGGFGVLFGGILILSILLLLLNILNKNGNRAF